MATQSVITDPAHEYIQQALKVGRAVKTELSLKALTVDLKFQARVDPYEAEHIRQLHEILRMQGWLAPIAVFEDPKDQALRVADGFTRTRTYQNDGRSAIPAFKMEGGELEALEFAVMANQQNTCRRRQEQDVRKAIKMLLKNEVWWHRSDSWIADHVGCTNMLVRTVRSEVMEVEKLEEPRMVDARSGVKVPYRRKAVEPKAERDSEERNKKIELDKTRDLRPIVFGRFLGSHGVTPIFKRSWARYGMAAYGGRGVVCQSWDVFDRSVLPAVIGQLIAGRRHIGANSRVVVACYLQWERDSIVDLYKAEGIEFMTPDELIASLGPVIPEELKSDS